jgi:uncharacterized protein YggU (UPF0235/DUF167 family)
MLYDVGSVTVRVQPRSPRPGVAVRGSEVLVRVRAAPVEGRATEEARRVLAEALRVPASSVTLRSGARSRTKIFDVEGVDRGAVEARLRGKGVQ